MNATKTTATATATAIRIAGREYSVTQRTGSDGLPVYRLTGKRGASYFTMRNVHNPLALFAVSYGYGSALDGVWLTDEGGALRTA